VYVHEEQLDVPTIQVRHGVLGRPG